MVGSSTGSEYQPNTLSSSARSRPGWKGRLSPTTTQQQRLAPVTSLVIMSLWHDLKLTLDIRLLNNRWQGLLRVSICLQGTRFLLLYKPGSDKSLVPDKGVYRNIVQRVDNACCLSWHCTNLFHQQRPIKDDSQVKAQADCSSSCPTIGEITRMWKSKHQGGEL